MSTPPKEPAAPGSRENLGLDKDAPQAPEKDAEQIDEEGEPFDGNFA